MYACCTREEAHGRAAPRNLHNHDCDGVDILQKKVLERVNYTFECIFKPNTRVARSGGKEQGWEGREGGREGERGPTPHSTPGVSFGFSE